MVTWTNLEEQDVFKRLYLMYSFLDPLRLDQCKDNLAIALNRKIIDDIWDPIPLVDFANNFKLQMSLHDINYEVGFMVLDYIFDKLTQQKRANNHSFLELAPFYTVFQNEHLDLSLGIIMMRLNDMVKEVQRANISKRDPTPFIQTSALLAGYGHIVRMETKGMLTEKRLLEFMKTQNCIPEMSERKLLVQEFMTLKTKGCDQIADVYHIRHAFAHAHFKFTSNQEIELWDISTKRDSVLFGKETFHENFRISDILNIFNIFEKKLSLADYYMNIFVCYRFLHMLNKKAWKDYPLISEYSRI